MIMMSTDSKIIYQEKVRNTLISHKKEYEFLAGEYAELHDIQQSVINQEKSKVIDKLYHELIDNRSLK